MRYRLITGVSIAAFVVYPPALYGWWGFVHYRIAREIADTVGAVDPNYAMGPDLFKPHAGFWGLYEITTGFAFSHGVQLSDLDPPPADAPQYPHDGRYPGRTMYDLLTNKLAPTTIAGMQGPAPYQQDPWETAKGFVVHNASDNIVHWDYFLGGPDPSGCSGFLYMWRINHEFKEEWANYIVLFLKDARSNGGAGGAIQLFRGPGTDGVMGTTDDIFSSLTEDANGNGKLDEGEDQNGDGQLSDYTNDIFGPPGADGQRRLLPYLLNLHPISFKVNAPIVHLAMKAYRKNRRMTDVSTSGQESSEFEINTIAQIQSRFEDQILTGSEAAMAELADMTLLRFQELNQYASSVNAQSYTGCAVPGWYPSDVMVRYDWCVQRGIAWLANIGN